MKRQPIPPVWTDADWNQIYEVIQAVKDRFKLDPWDLDPDLSRPRIRQLCRKMVGDYLLSQPQAHTARCMFMREGRDGLGNVVLIP